MCQKKAVNVFTHFGTMTSKVVKYSLSRIKCSFFTKSAKFRVNKLPLVQIKNCIVTFT